MVVQVKEKVLVLDQPFLQPDAVHRVEVLEGLDGVHWPAFHLTHSNQLIRPKISFSGQFRRPFLQELSLPIALRSDSRSRERPVECQGALDLAMAIGHRRLGTRTPGFRRC
jgi:hypothetical protein